MQRSYRKKEIIKVKKIGRVRHKKAASVDRWGEKKEERTENNKTSQFDRKLPVCQRIQSDSYRAT